MDADKIYPRIGDRETVYLKSLITNPNIIIGDYTMYNDFVNSPTLFEKNNVLYQNSINGDKLIMGKYCSVDCGAKFLLTSSNHTKRSLSTYPFGIFFEEWGPYGADIKKTWDNKGDIVIGNDVWIGYEAVITSGVHIGDGAIIGPRAVVTEDVQPYMVVEGIPGKAVRKRFDDNTIKRLLEMKWWNWPDEKVKENIEFITEGRINEIK